MNKTKWLSLLYTVKYIFGACGFLKHMKDIIFSSMANIVDGHIL